MSAQPTSINLGLSGMWLADLTLRSVGAGIALFDADARIRQLDARAAELLALAGASQIGLSLDDERWAAIHLDSTAVTRDSDPVRSVLADPSKSVADVVGIRDEQGDTRWLALTALHLSARDGVGSGVLVSIVEVTGVIRDRAAVDRAEQLGRASFERASAPMCVVELDGTIVEWNRSFASMIDRPDYEIIQTSIERWVVGALPSHEQPVGAAQACRWVDGPAVGVRAWPYDPHAGGRWMLELSACGGE